MPNVWLAFTSLYVECLAPAEVLIVVIVIDAQRLKTEQRMDRCKLAIAFFVDTTLHLEIYIAMPVNTNRLVLHFAPPQNPMVNPGPNQQDGLNANLLQQQQQPLNYDVQVSFFVFPLSVPIFATKRCPRLCVEVCQRLQTIFPDILINRIIACSRRCVFECAQLFMSLMLTHTATRRHSMRAATGNADDDDNDPHRARTISAALLAQTNKQATQQTRFN